ncbi:MAG: CsgG/HfaB family protein, partial [Prevotellaceae bacterium]|nr:CsgG/HfaB family protein [Prevotellaceae bacterium]
MKKIFTLLLICLCISTVYGQEKKKVAIFESIGNAVDEDVKGAILDALGEGIYNSDKYILLERANYAQLLKEYDFQQSGAVDDEQLLEIGKAAGADYACYASIRKIGINYRIAYRLVEVSTAAIEFSGSKSTKKGINDLLDVINAIAEEMFKEKNDDDVKTEIPKSTPKPTPTPTITPKPTPTQTPVQKQPTPTNVAQTSPTTNSTANSPIVRSVMELIKQKLGQKINNYNTDEDKFERVKSDSEMKKLIKFSAKFVAATPPQSDGSNII